MTWWPDIEKFMPLSVCYGAVLFALALFVAVLVVIGTSRRERESDG